MNLLIKHNRFKRNLEENELSSFLPIKKKIFDFPHTGYKYFNFFNNYAKKNYQLSPTKCLCKLEDDIPLSLVDRYGVRFHIVICKNCGLIRAKEMYSSSNLSNFYQNFYRDIIDDNPTNKSPEEFYKIQYQAGRLKFELISKFSIQKITNETKIIDIGGGAGGVLENFKPSENLYLADFFEPYLDIAKKNGIHIINGGPDKIDFQPDIIILSHVVEHWENFDNEIQKIIKLQKPNKTINYIEFPGVDSLKDGRKGGDILGDIHIPHIYYFASYVFENIMNRNGFEKIYSDTHCRSIYLYTDTRKPLINYFSKVHKDLIEAERRRKYEGFKRLVKYILPKKILGFIKNKIKKS